MEIHDKYLSKAQDADEEIEHQVKTLQGTEAELSDEETKRQILLI